MAERTKKRKPSKKQGTIKRIGKRARPSGTGVDMSDLVGTIRLSEDPVAFQRALRDEGE